MKEYCVRKLDSEGYNVYLLCLTFDSILNYIEDIEQDVLIKGNSGTMIIDQLLATGNEKNRFISCQYVEGSIVLSSAKNVMPSIVIKHIALQSLQKNYYYIQNSILSEGQLLKIQQGTFM